jgi:predicted RNase H-like HicB family nuclease
LTLSSHRRKIEFVKTTYTVVLDREDDGRVIASVPGLPGCHAYGSTAGQAVRKVKAGLRFYLQELARLGQKPPQQPKPITVQISIAV